MAGRPRKRSGKTCGAIKKDGIPCRCIMLFKGGRCKYHAGKSLNGAEKARITAETGRIFKKTGPNTPEGLARIGALAKARGFAKLQAGYLAWIEERRRLKAAELEKRNAEKERERIKREPWPSWVFEKPEPEPLQINISLRAEPRPAPQAPAPTPPVKKKVSQPEKKDDWDTPLQYEKLGIV
jgi:hypothetical protein